MSDDYIERLMGRAAGWGDGLDDTRGQRPAKPVEKKHTVRRDMFDRAAWDQITDQVPALGEQVAEAQEKHDERAAYGYEDLFNLLNQGDPRFTGVDQMVAEFVPQHAMFESMFESDDFQWVRTETKYDSYNTALAMLSMQERMDDAFDAVQEANEAIEQAKQELQEALEAAKAFLEAGGEPGDGEPGDGPVIAVEGAGEGQGTEQEIINRLEKALDGMAQAQEQGEQASDEAGANLRAGAKDAKDAIEQEQQSAQSYGVEPGQLKYMDYEERRRLSERLNQTRLARFAKMLGGFRMAFDAERRRRVNHAPAVVYDVELGQDIHNLVGSEITNLAMPETEDLFWLRYAKHELQQWVTRGPERAGQGPIIVVCDESYSMTSSIDDEGNSCEAWSKAVSLGLVDQAKRDNRDFIYIGFGSPGQQWETRFEGGSYDHNQIIDFAEHFFGGGTHYETPLTRAMEIIGEYEKARKAKPDVVLITDGICHVGEDFIEAWRKIRERADVRCYGIQIGGTSNYDTLDNLVDRLIQINQLNATPDAVTELFRTI